MKNLVLICLFFGLMIVACGDNKEENQTQKMQDSAKVEENATNDNLAAKEEPKEDITKATKEVAQNNTTEKIVAKEEKSTPAQKEAATKAANITQLYAKCVACHGINGDKIAPGSVGGVLISNLSAKEIGDSLKGYRAKTLNKGGTAAIMYMQTSKLSDEDIDALSNHISKLKK